MTATKKARESSARVKGFWEMRMVDPKVDKSNHVKDACVSDLLKTNCQAHLLVANWLIISISW